MFANLGIAVVELVAAVVDHTATVPLEEPGIGECGSHGRGDADHFHLEPESGNHPLGADMIHHLHKAAVREAVGRFLPFTHGGPPGFLQCGEPSSIDHEIFAADLRRRIDDRQKFFGGRLRHEAVHVIIEDDRHLLHIGMRKTDQSAHGVEFLQRAGKASLHAADGGGHGGEALTLGQPLAPVAFAEGGAGDQDIEFIGDVADFPVPGTVVLDLPEEGFAGLRVFEGPERKMSERGPRSMVGDRDAIYGESGV